MSIDAGGSLVTEFLANATNMTATAPIPSPVAVAVSTLAPFVNVSGNGSATAAAAVAKMPSPAQIAAKKAMLAYMFGKIHTLQLFLLLGYGIMCFLCLALITYLRFNRHVAFKGDETAARKIILPAFEPLLCILAAATGVYTIFFCTALLTDLYTYDISKLATEVFYSGRQFVFLSVVVFMLQKSVSGPALRRSIVITFALSTYTIPIVWYTVKYRPATELYTVITTSRAPMLLLYTYIFIRPPGRATKRTLREFCLFAYAYYALLFTYNELFHQKKVHASRAASGAGDPTGAVRMTVKGTVDYMAPEIIQGRAGQATYGEAADVYSLGITMWDILNPGREKFPTSKNNHFLVFENVTAGERPEMDVRMHPRLRAVIEGSWSGDARLRPSAQTVVAALEDIQEELFAAFAMELSDELEDAFVGTRQQTSSLTDQSFTGAQAVDLMMQSRYVSSASEATRIGNALMDAGLMHHLKHAWPFEGSDALFYFDESNINLCKPLVVGAFDVRGRETSAHGDRETDDEGDSNGGAATGKLDTSAAARRSRKISHVTSSTNGNTISEYLRGGGSSQSDQPILENGLCACSKLGQRLQAPKASVRRRFRRKYRVAAEDNVLAARLLQEQSSVLSSSDTDRLRFDTSDFDFVDRRGDSVVL
ncbi:hypothetical protein PybrP1_002601 [[Pythium] brassicae (nom. inval.)]|nr:hypothetical protein PybrP1_002601 [[Pythium] brassicae (nom. inval.)]